MKYCLMYKPPQLTCQFCDKTFSATRKGQKFCTTQCRSLAHWHSKHKDSGYYSRRDAQQLAKALRLGRLTTSSGEELRVKIGDAKSTLEGQ